MSVSAASLARVRLKVIPTVAATKASQAGSEGGLDNSTYMTPLRTKQQIDARLSTQPEAEAGTNNTQTMTPLRSKQQIDARLADQATAEAGTDNFELMTALRTEQRIDKQFGNWVSVLTFGAKCDGVTDDTAAFEAAIRSLPYPDGGTVYAPNGEYLIGHLDMSFSPNIRFDFKGIVIAKNATGDVIDANNCTGFVWENPRIRMKDGVVKTQGAFINLFRTSFYQIKGGDLRGHYLGIEADGGAIGILKDINFRNATPSSVAPGSGHIRVGHTEFCVVILIDGIIADNDTTSLTDPDPDEMSSFGINIQNCDAPVVSNVDIMRSGRSLVLDPATGESCINGFFHHSYFDTATHGIVTGGRGGSVNNHHFTRVWTGGHSQYGRYLGAGTNSIFFLGCQASFCDLGGSIMTDGCFGVDWVGELASGNGGPGITIADGTSDFRIRDSRLGRRDTFFGENAYPIYIGTGCDDYIVTDNRLSDNTNPMADLSKGTATKRYVARNIGYKTAAKGVQNLIAGATTAVITHGLAETPKIADIQFVPVGDVSGRVLWLDNTSITSTTFTVGMSGGALGYNISVSWRAATSDAQA